jgi:hypothetical protein
MVKVISFKEALKQSNDYKKRHLMLGNGFSIALRPEIFTYKSLLEEADFSEAPHLSTVFEKIGTQDFEKVIRLLEDSAKILPIYAGTSTDPSAQMQEDAKYLKGVLIKTVAQNHPEFPGAVDGDEFEACREFLSNFVGPKNKGGRIYTLNYDLLLYWALMHEDTDDKDRPLVLSKNDGFGRDEDTDPNFVDWMGESSSRDQRIHYLHGALHLFDAGTQLQKYTWVNTGLRLLDQAQDAMHNDKYPLFVAEGTSDQKLSKIKHSAYLYHSYKSFSEQMKQPNDVLFIFGHSLADNDRHILKKISGGKIPRVFVGLYGDPENETNKLICQAANLLERARRADNPLEISYFDAKSAEVWG